MVEEPPVNSYHKEILNNGLRVITEEIPYVRSCSIGILIGTGTKNEEDTQLGISHFIEHLCFKGTKNRGAKEIATSIEKTGGYLNAATDKEYTYYYCKTLSDNIWIALDILVDIVLNSTLDKKEIEREKKVILEEIKTHEDSPSDYIHEIFVQTIWKGAKLGRSILGKKETVIELEQEEIINFRNKNYLPSNMIVAAAGYLNCKEFINKVKKYFNKNFNNEKIKKNKDYKLKVNPEVVIKNKDTKQVHFCIGGKGSSQTDEDRYTLSVLGTLLGIGMSSRLFQLIREKKGLVYSIYAFAYSYLKNGLFGVYAGCKEENLLKTIELIIKEFKQLKHKGITKEELNKTKEQLKGSLMLSLESTLARLDKLVRAEFYLNRNITLDEIINEINKVKIDDVIKKSEEIFKSSGLSCTCLGKLDEKYKEKVEEIIYDI